jgi:hypothetical protein
LVTPRSASPGVIVLIAVVKVATPPRSSGTRTQPSLRTSAKPHRGGDAFAKRAAPLCSVGSPSSPSPAAPPTRQVVIRASAARDLLARLEAADPAPCPETSTEARWNAAVGCKTSEVASALLAQLIQLEHPRSDPTAIPAALLDAALMTATATLAELQPASATEALLAAQMVGAQRAAMVYLHRALMPEQESEAVDRNVTRAVRLMRVFTEQVETMAKLKGKGSHQRVVVEHVTVAAGGQAIVGTVIPRGRGENPDDGR